VTPAVTARAFSPNGDGLLDTTSLSFAASERATGTVRLVKGSTTVRTWRVSDVTSWHATWDGRRGDGTRAPDGVYGLVVRVRDGGGNLRTATTRVVVDRTLRGLRWGGDLFPQDGDALKATSVLSFGLARGARTTLRIEDAAGRVVRTAWIRRSLGAGTRTFRWNGRNDAGRLVPQGRYLATLRVQGPSATIEYTRWVWAAAFTVTPDRATVRPGRTLTVRFRSVEPLATKPRVSFTQPGRAAVTVTATRLADGSYRARFVVRSGASGPAFVRVGATDTRGSANVTRVGVRVVS
jgi:flagellar hook assembly protein FlgD